MECKGCGKEFKGRRDARYCSARCKMRVKRNKVVTDVTSVTDKSLKVTKGVTDNVTDKSLEIIKRLTVKVDEQALRIHELEIEIGDLRAGKARTNHKEDKMDATDLFKRVMREKEDRLRGEVIN